MKKIYISKAINFDTNNMFFADCFENGEYDGTLKVNDLPSIMVYAAMHDYKVVFDF